MKIYLKSIVLLSVIQFIASCESNTYQEVEAVTLNPTYQKDIKPIIDANCIVCHNESSTIGPFSLTNYDNVKAITEFGTLIFRIETATGIQSMPLNAPKLSESKIKLIKLWASNGYPN